MSKDTTFRTVRYRVKPLTRGKHLKMLNTINACRFVWNHFLAKNKREYGWHKAAPSFNMEYPKPLVSAFSLFNEFTKLRKETPWLQELPCAIVRYVLKYQADAWKNAFKHGGFPRFKSRYRDGQSFTISQKVTLKGEYLRVPKIGLVKLIDFHRLPYSTCKPVKAVIKFEFDRWYAFVTYEVPVSQAQDDHSAIAIDCNVRQVADSTGVIHRMPDLSKKEARKRRYQRKMARQVKGSNRRNKTKLRLARISRDIANVRKNWHHHLSKYLAGSVFTVYAESLNTKGMTKKGKGKKGLNREILNTGWSSLFNMLGYKSGKFLQVNPAYTSQTCNSCGTVDKMNRKTQAEFHCVHCGHTDNADINAALNILASGIGASARGGGSVSWPVNCEHIAEPA